MTLPPTHGVVKHVETSVGQLAYRIDGDGEPLLLCQRFKGTIDDWDPAFVEALVATGRRIIRFDNAGIGWSTGTTPSSMPEMADGALAFAEALALDSFDVLGWSLGGEVAQWMALKAPTRIRSLILAGTSPGAISEVAPDPEVASVKAKPQQNEADFLYLFFGDSDASLAAGKASLGRVAAVSAGPTVSEAAIAAQQAASKSYGAGPDASRPRLGEMAMPILVANGNRDRMLPPFGSFVIARDAPNAKLVLYPDAGHAFLFQYVDEFVSEIDRFLRAIA
ncbi:alpha/beta fold hydrolase [Aureimonas sp. AU40]|uniref:alpha/beta fold hydrolase n=1 Tax=Aureimonas sp. AU40 TaxID=1637747 RepID=UPI000781CF0B|nr:alpha/beta hydrolase [Aureimonas sp. AU40]